MENEDQSKVEGQEENNVQQEEKDWKAEYEKAIAEARKWEGRSKKNAEKAKAYDDLAEKSMTDAEKTEAAIKRAEEAERQLSELQRQKDAAEVSAAFNVPISLITASDREGMEEQARAIKEYADNKQSAQVFRDDGKRPGPAPTSSQDVFFEFLQSQM